MCIRDSGEVYIYRYSEDEDGNPSLDNIDSDEEYEVVSEDVYKRQGLGTGEYPLL